MNYEATYSDWEYPELTPQKLHDAISLIYFDKYKDVPIRFEVSPSLEAGFRRKLEPAFYAPASPNTTLNEYMGMPIIIDYELPSDVIVFVYKTAQGERKEAKIFNLEAMK